MTCPEAGSGPTADEAVRAADCWDPSAGTGGADLEELIGLLAEDLSNVISRTLADRSPFPARDFTDRIIETDLAMATESDEAGTLGQSVAYLVLSSWWNSVSAATFDPTLTQRAVDWVRAELPLECAAPALRAADAVGPAADHEVTQIADELADDFLPGLIWLAVGLVAKYGDSDPTWFHNNASLDH
jgi:hypothetical protein